jgi:hypothetical protein
MKRLVLVLGVLAAAVSLAILAAPGAGIANGNDDDQGGDGAYAIGLWGDVPYTADQQTVGVPNLIAAMNRGNLAFTVHDGDLKQGSGSLCDDALYVRSLGYLNSLRAPAIYTPGDNEWTDCDRASNGGFNSLERLNHIRSTMFTTTFSFGQRKMRQDVQGAPYVEDRRWQLGDVTYFTLDIPGSDNNLGDVSPDPSEWAARNAATIAWLHAGFDYARAHHSKGVMIVTQANMGFDRFDALRSPPRDPQTLVADFQAPNSSAGEGYDEFLLALRAEVIDFAKPVVLVHGDSHYFRIDKPLLDRNGNRIEWFTRLETPGDNQQSGSNDVEWVKATVSGDDPEVFSFEPEIVAPNLSAYVP